MKKEKIAQALRFDPNIDAAPQIIAKGNGLIAEKIIEVAKENRVKIYEDEVLANQLHNLEVGNEIPYELYEVVAEVLVFISSLDEEF